LLTITDLCASYGKAEVIHQLSLEVKEGEMMSIIGPNGAGKTTLLRCINGLMQTDKGDIVFEGKSIKKLPTHKIARLGITHCPEGRRPFPEMTVFENLKMGALHLSHQKFNERLEYVYSLFPILHERQRQYAGTMSGGQQQMVAIGRALMTSPKLLILDEPSIGLAPLIVDEIFQQINIIKESGVTILLVEQNVDVALKVTDKIAVMDNGQISFMGNPAELVNDSNLREIYLGIG
jgi:branched-chain amino acid transport system ATP-binding protein